MTPSTSRGPRGQPVRRKIPAGAPAASAARATTSRTTAAAARASPWWPLGTSGHPGQPRSDSGLEPAGLPPALTAGASARPGPGPQLGRAGALPLLQRLVPPRALPARSQPGQSAGRRGPAGTAWLPACQPALLPAHALRGRFLHGREQHLEDCGPSFRHCLRLPGLKALLLPRGCYAKPGQCFSLPGTLPPSGPTCQGPLQS